MAEFFREFAFISALLGGFSLVLFGTLLDTGRNHRTVEPAAVLALASSSCFLIVTLGNTFAASVATDPVLRVKMNAVITGQLGPLSMLFIVGIVFLLGCFGSAGWIRSRRLGWTTTCMAVATFGGVLWVLQPFISIH